MIVAVTCGRCATETTADVPRECCNSLEGVLFAGIVLHEVEHHLHEIGETA